MIEFANNGINPIEKHVRFFVAIHTKKDAIKKNELIKM